MIGYMFAILDKGRTLLLLLVMCLLIGYTAPNYLFHICFIYHASKSVGISSWSELPISCINVTLVFSSPFYSHLALVNIQVPTPDPALLTDSESVATLEWGYPPGGELPISCIM